jgi:hypothetical protein
MVVDPKLTPALRAERRNLCDQGFVNQRASAEQNRLRIQFPSPDMTLSRANNVATARAVVTANSVMTDVACVVCAAIIPAYFARIVCHSGLDHEVHLHGSYPCCVGVTAQIKKHGGLQFGAGPLDLLAPRTILFYERLAQEILQN